MRIQSLASAAAFFVGRVTFDGWESLDSTESVVLDDVDSISAPIAC